MDKRVVSPEVKLAYHRSGGGPAVVLVHGLGGDETVWDATVAHLAPTHTVVTVTLPGHADTQAPATVDLGAIARALAGLVRAEALAPVVLVGHSLGGLLAAHVPLVDPAAVSGVVILDAVACSPSSMEQMKPLHALAARDYPAMLHAFFAPLCQANQLERILRSARRVSPEMLFRYIHCVVEQPLMNRIGDVQVPLLLMVTTALLDPQKPREPQLHALGYAKVRDMSIESFTEARHWLFWDEPAHFHRSLDAFLARIAAR